MDNFYRENILDHYFHPRNFGKLKKFDCFFEEENSLCGDKIVIRVKLKNGKKSKKIGKIKFFGQGCAISIASASMLTEKVKGMTIEKIQKIKKEDILKMLGTKLTPTRIKCALLPLEVLQRALTKLSF